MPRVSRKTKRIRRGWTDRDRLKLLSGHDYGRTFGPEPLLDEDVDAAWADLRDELMERHVRRTPGSRPWGWWAVESPEPRRRRRGKCREHPGEACEYFKGVCDADDPDMYETETEYLQRLGLLEDDEVSPLARGEKGADVAAGESLPTRKRQTQRRPGAPRAVSCAESRQANECDDEV